MGNSGQLRRVGSLSQAGGSVPAMLFMQSCDLCMTHLDHKRLDHEVVVLCPCPEPIAMNVQHPASRVHVKAGSIVDLYCHSHTPAGNPGAFL